MKVVFINMSFKGHHLDYIKSLSEIDGIEAVVLSPKVYDGITARQIPLSDCVFGSMKIHDHMKWIKKVKKVINVENPDYVHFTWGDSFYRFFGIGFSSICKKYNCGITFHQVRKDRVHVAAIKCYSRIFKDVIVHTDELSDYLLGNNVRNIRHIEYPNFRKNVLVDVNTARNELGINTDAKVLLCLGGTRSEKGLDILLEALKDVTEPFFLLVAGAEQNIKREFIYESTKQYKEKTKILLKFLSDRELECCLSSADVVVLPYRKTFNGASGPLAEGVGYGKCIVGSNHGSLGRIIRENHIGYTFKSEDIKSLSQTLSKALRSNFEYDTLANNYRKRLTVSTFQKEYLALYQGMERG